MAGKILPSSGLFTTILLIVGSLVHQINTISSFDKTSHSSKNSGKSHFTADQPHLETGEDAPKQEKSEKVASWSHFCTGGKDPSKMAIKDYMAAFAAGPCAPTILLPGIMGSVLEVQINCAQLRAADPATFKDCGWTTCPGDADHTVESSPNSEYQIWVPGITSPMTIASPTESSKMCFGNLVQVGYDTSTGKVKPVNKPGITFGVKGFTPETKGLKNSQCGTTGVEDLIDGIIDPEVTQYFKLFINRLLEMGYKSGLTLQAIPYDFRLLSGEDQASSNLGTLIKTLSSFNNKKVVIVAHSMGNSKTMYGLWHMSQADKDSSIAAYFAVAPPFIGAAKPIDYLTCGSSEFFFLHFGIDMKTWKLSAGSFTSVFELAPSTTYLTQANQPWMQKILARINYEAGKSSDPVFNFLPTTSQICYKNYTQKNCASGLEFYDNYINYKGTTVGNQGYRDWINQHSFNSHGSQIWPTIDGRFETMPNLGVPVVVAYTQVLETEGKYKYNIDPKIAADANRYCTDKEVSWTPWKGDGTVPSTSAMTAALKWAYEFQTGLAGSKPVKVVDLCSQYNVKYSPWDSKSATGENLMTNLEYQGLPCDCSQGKDRHCDHEGMLFLPEMIEYLSNTVTTRQTTTVSPTVAGMTEQQLQAYQSNCNILMTLNHVSAE